MAADFTTHILDQLNCHLKLKQSNGKTLGYFTFGHPSPLEEPL